MVEASQGGVAPPAHFHEPLPAAPIDCGVQEVLAEWIDFNGHMNVGYYAVAMDRGVVVALDQWLDWGGGYARREGMGPFALQSQFHYLNELREGECFRVLFTLLDCDHKRIHYLAEMRRERDGAAAALLENLSINVDLQLRRSAPFPERQRLRFAACLAAHRELPRPPQVGASLGIRRA